MVTRFSWRFLVGIALIGTASVVAWHPSPALSAPQLIRVGISDRFVDVDASDDGLVAYTVAQRIVSANPAYTAKARKSSDGGVTWSELASAPAGYWTAVATSSDGGTVAIVGEIDGSGTGHRLFISTDGGTTWNQKNSGTEAYTDVAVSGGAGTIVVARPTSGVEYTTDGGLNWTPVDTDSSTAGIQPLIVRDIAINSDGRTITLDCQGYCYQL